jgi:hypothetical protein
VVKPTYICIVVGQAHGDGDARRDIGSHTQEAVREHKALEGDE